MRIDVARGVRYARNVKPLVVQRLLVGELAGTQHVLEPPDLRDGGEMEPLRGRGEPHGTNEIPLKHRKPASNRGPISMSCPV